MSSQVDKYFPRATVSRMQGNKDKLARVLTLRKAKRAGYTYGYSYAFKEWFALDPSAALIGDYARTRNEVIEHILARVAQQ